MVQSPVLFITFSRPEYARQTWESIKLAQPKVLYFYSNKARADRVEEQERNDEIRSYITEINWDCDLHLFFQVEHVDIYTSLRSAISWLFNNETEGIILEEDCVPTMAFFSFCDQMLSYYRDEQKVWCISGDNYLDYSPKGKDYFFSHSHFMFGWASWANRWNQIPWDNIPVNQLCDSDLESFYQSKSEAKQRRREIKSCMKLIQEKKCWDYAWGVVIDINEGVTILPNRHLVTCVGLTGTHSKLAKKTLFHKSANPIGDIYDVKNRPKVIEADLNYDHELAKEYEKYSRLHNRIYRRLYAIIAKLFKR